jgi:Domain of unknown function (DUF4157)
MDDVSQDDEDIDAAADVPLDDLSEEIARKWDPDKLLRLVAKRAGKGERLDATLRARYERKFGVDLSHVRIYTGEFAEEFNKSRGADAVTIGSTGMILMGGHPDKAVGADAQALLAHELTHVAQAQRGLHFAGVDAPLATEEHEAEAEHVEAGERQEAQGGAAAAAQEADNKAADDKKQLEEQITHRVLDMFAETGRVVRERGGPPPRRA